MTMGRRKKVIEVTSDGDEMLEECKNKKESKLKIHGANERERARMRVLSKAFGRLKTTLPWVPADTKLSKLDTLRLASSYIAHLRRVLKYDDEDEAFPGTALGNGTASVAESSAPAKETSEKGSIHPLALTWPYTAHNRVGGASSAGRSRDHGTPITTSS